MQVHSHLAVAAAVAGHLQSRSLLACIGLQFVRGLSTSATASTSHQCSHVCTNQLERRVSTSYTQQQQQLTQHVAHANLSQQQLLHQDAAMQPQALLAANQVTLRQVVQQQQQWNSKLVPHWINHSISTQLQQYRHHQAPAQQSDTKWKQGKLEQTTQGTAVDQAPEYQQGQQLDKLLLQKQVEQLQHRRQQQQQSTSFESLGTSAQLVVPLQRQGIRTPTPVQVAAFEHVRSGSNMAIQSSTGTGKTLSYLLPLLTMLEPWKPGKLPYRRGRVLVLCPTQELCMQVLHSARDLLPKCHRRIQPLVGGANPTRQLRSLKDHKPCIVVATPGRLMKLINKGAMFDAAFPQTLPKNYSAMNKMVLVLEEADKLLAMKDTQEVLKHLGALFVNSKDYQQQQHLPTSQQQRQPADTPLLDDDPQAKLECDQQELQRKHDKDCVTAVLQMYQVLMVSASLNPTTLAAAPAWIDSRPVTVVASPYVAQVLHTPTGSAAFEAAAAQNPRLLKVPAVPALPWKSSHTPESDVLATGCSERYVGLADSDPDLEVGRRLINMGHSELGELGSSDELRAEFNEAVQWDDSDDSEALELSGLAPHEAALTQMLPEHLQHQVLTYNGAKKLQLVKRLLKLLESNHQQHMKALVFVGQHANVKVLYEKLQLLRMGQGLQWLSYIDTELPYQERINRKRQFEQGHLTTLLLSDGYSMGLHFKGVELIVQADMPASRAQYVRRAGRTGRMGRPGTVVTLVATDKVELLLRLLKRLKINAQMLEISEVEVGSLIPGMAEGQAPDQFQQ